MRRGAAAAAVLAAATVSIASAGVPDSTLQGDARLRVDLRERELPDADSHRLLLRLRVSATATLAPGLTLGLGLTTGDPDDPRVTDVELGGGRVRRPLELDQAWLAWRPGIAPGLALTAGRMAMPLLCVQDLVYDGDWRPDGLAAAWTTPAGDGWRPHVRAASLWITEAEGGDLAVAVAQAALEWKHGRDWRFLGGAGYHSVDDTAGSPPPLRADSAQGNTLRPTAATDPESCEVLAEDFRIVEVFSQLTWDPWFPVTVYGQAVRNTAASADAEAWLAGLSIGRTRAVGALELGWNVRHLAADAVLSALADSDFAGGGTDVEGHKIYARYHAFRDVVAGVAWFDGVRDPEGVRLRETLWQVDLSMRF